MPRDEQTGLFTRVDNSFSNPIARTIISPGDADTFFDDVESAVNAFLGTSTSSVAIGIGAKTLVIDDDAENKIFLTGTDVRAFSLSDPGDYMVGSVTSYDENTGDLVLDVVDTGGSGTVADWVIVSAGAIGPAGPPSGIRQSFDSSTSDADPGAGQFRLNNATPSSATAAYLDNLDFDGGTVSSIIDKWDDSTSTVRGSLRIESELDPSIWAEFSVTGSVVDGTGYRKLTLSSGSHNGTFVADDTFRISFIRSGDAGASGVFMGTRLAKTANYTVDNTDKGKTIALGGTAYFTLTFSAASGYDSNFAVSIVNEDTGRAKSIAISGGTTFKLYPLQTAVVFNNNNTWSVHRNERWKLTGTLNVYVDTAGSSSNDGLATGASGAFATIQQAFDEIANNYDLKAGNAVTINLSTGTHTTGLHASVKPVGAEGGAQIIISGAGAANTTLSTTSSDCIGAFVDCTLQVRAMKLQTTTSGSCISAGLGARIYVLDDVVYGACATYHTTCNGHSQILLQQSYQISGGAVAHMAISGPGSIEVTAGITATWSAGSAFTYFALAGQLGYIGAASVTYNTNAQTVTGARYFVANNAVIDTGGGGANYFPGNSVGMNSNGLYV